MSWPPPRPPPPSSFPEAFPPRDTRSTNTRRDVTADSAHLQGGQASGHGHAPQLPSSTGYPSQSYSSPQQPQTSPRRSTLQTTAEYDHASSSSYPSPPPLSGSTSYNPSFPVPARYPDTNPSGPPPPPPISHRSATMPIPIPNTASSVPYDMQHPNVMHPPSHREVPGGPQPTGESWSYLSVHDRGNDSSGDEDNRQSREGTSLRREGGYMPKGPPNRSAAGRQHGGHGGYAGGYAGGAQPSRPVTGPPPPELLRCMICGRVSPRATVDYRRGQCEGGHMGQWRRV